MMYKHDVEWIKNNGVVMSEGTVFKMIDTFFSIVAGQ